MFTRITLAVLFVAALFGAGSKSDPDEAPIRGPRPVVVTPALPAPTPEEPKPKVRKVVRWKVKRVKKHVPAIPIPPAGNRIVQFSPGCRLVEGAAASLSYAESLIGPIRTSDCYRTHEQQAAAYAAKPGLAAAPGHSQHEEGLAIDVSSVGQRLVRVLYALGWNRFAPGYEPWHFSYRVTG